MSTSSSARRVKERVGGADKITPASGKSSVSTGKENPRPTSRIRATSQKPSVQPIVRIDKSAAALVDPPRVRRSTSSVPRGRSSSPSEFTRVLSELRKDSRVSMGPSQMKVNSSRSNEKTGGRFNLQNRVSKDIEKNGLVWDEAKVLRNGGIKKKMGSSGSISVKNTVLEKNVSNNLKETLDELDGRYQGNLEMNARVKSCYAEKKDGTLSSVLMKRSDHVSNEKSNTDNGKKVKASEERKSRSSGIGVDVDLSLRESKMLTDVSTSVRESGASKYPSKLHEKLAFLEGKVKRIASDIKRTKEILDTNNPDTSKIILCDIQEKISGIEKAMGNVVGDDASSSMGSAKCQNEDKNDENVMDAKSLSKGLNVEELEARLFPHHKLIRDRTLLKTADGESKNTMNMEEDKAISFDANPIALEFVASSSKMETNFGEEVSEVQEVDDAVTSVVAGSSMIVLNAKGNPESLLLADEKFNDFDNQENVPTMVFEVDEDISTYPLNDIGGKSSTGGWFVSEGESVLLACDDGSCSFYDITNSEEKAEYKPPVGVSPKIWRDCWMVRAPSADGCSGKYIVAASAGNSVGSGFCSWDFYTKDVKAVHIEEARNSTMHRRNLMLPFMAPENQQWWYKPCGPLITSTTTCQRAVQIYDIRDGERVMKWELAKPVSNMEYASPLHWRNRGKVVIAELDAISLWDVNSLTSQALLSVSSSDQKISALHVNNTDAELGGGVRQRVSSSEVEGNDGVFCTADYINVLDFRQPSGIGLKIPKHGIIVQSVFSRGDSIYIGCSTTLSSTVRRQSLSQILHFSLRKQSLLTTYSLPESNAPNHFTALTQVWGNSSIVMGVSKLGLFVFDSSKDDGVGLKQNVKEIIGPDDMCSPSFDYLDSRVLIVSRDRPACWRYLL